MKRVNTEKIGAALDGFFADNPEIAARISETRAMKAWDDVMGGIFKRYTEKMFIKNRTLFLKITSPVVKSELLMLREKLIERLNLSAGNRVLDNIVLL